MAKVKDLDGYEVPDTSIWNQQLANNALEFARLGMSNTDIANAVGIDSVTLYKWLGEKPVFSMEFRKAKVNPQIVNRQTLMELIQTVDDDKEHLKIKAIEAWNKTYAKDDVDTDKVNQFRDHGRQYLEGDPPKETQ